jgi:hypothetical protein
LNGYARRVIGVLSRKFDQEAEARFAARIRERNQTCSGPIATTSLRDKCDARQLLALAAFAVLLAVSLM